jgi:hypothetical protein
MTKVEEAKKDNNPSSSPSKVLSQQSMDSEQQKWKATNEAQHLDSSLPPTRLLGPTFSMSSLIELSTLSQLVTGDPAGSYAGGTSASRLCSSICWTFTV